MQEARGQPHLPWASKLSSEEMKQDPQTTKRWEMAGLRGCWCFIWPGWAEHHVAGSAAAQPGASHGNRSAGERHVACEMFSCPTCTNPQGKEVAGVQKGKAKRLSFRFPEGLRVQTGAGLPAPLPCMQGELNLSEASKAAD